MTIVTVYTTGPGCPQCALTEKAMSAAGIPFTEVDLTDDANAAARDYVTGDLGHARAPVVVVDDHDHWSGFQPDLIKRLAEHIGRLPRHIRDGVAPAVSLRDGTSASCDHSPARSDYVR